MTDDPLDKLIDDLNIGDPSRNPMYVEEDGLPTKECINHWGRHWRKKHDNLLIAYLGLKKSERFHRSWSWILAGALIGTFVGAMVLLLVFSSAEGR